MTNTEQRLIDAFEGTKLFSPSDDLWTRVVYSIEEDRGHRRRVWIAMMSVVVGVLVLFGVVALSFVRVNGDLRIGWERLEVLESVVLLLLGGLLAPLIRRFGRGYVDDMFPSGTGVRLLRLLDIGFYLIVGGYIALTARFAPPISYLVAAPADQLEEVAARVAGLLLLLGILHALLMMSLPLESLVFNSTRVGAKLPRWVFAIVLVAGAMTVLFLPMVFSFVLGFE